MKTIKPRLKIRRGKLKKGILGESNSETGEITIDIKAHKGDRREVASSLKHELLHLKHPKMTEKQVYKRTAKTKISPNEQRALLSRLREGKIRKQLKVSRDEKLEPGDLINKAKELSETTKTSIAGLV